MPRLSRRAIIISFVVYAATLIYVRFVAFATQNTNPSGFFTALAAQVIISAVYLYFAVALTAINPVFWWECHFFMNIKAAGEKKSFGSIGNIEK